MLTKLTVTLDQSPVVITGWPLLFIHTTPGLRQMGLMSSRALHLFWTLIYLERRHCFWENSKKKKKSRDVTLPTKVCLVKAMVFPVVMDGYESWTINKAECRRIDAFDLCCWIRLLRVPWTARRSNQSILKEISPGCSLEGRCWSWNSNTLATSCEELTHWKRLWCWEGLGAGGEGDDRGWDGWMASPTQWTGVWVNSRVGDGQGGLACYSPWGHKESDTTEWLNWTELTIIRNFLYSNSCF